MKENGDSPQQLERKKPRVDRRKADVRFREALSRVKKVGDCWLWDGSTDADGYGLFSGTVEGTRYVRAHRFSYLFHIGTHPRDKLVCHTCDTPRCINPRHLFLGSIADNNEDMTRKGRNRHLSGEAHRAAHAPESFSRGVAWWNDQRRENNRIDRGDNWSTTKLPDAVVVEIRRRWKAKEAKQVDMAKEYGVSKQLINLICLGKARKALPALPTAAGGSLGGNTDEPRS
ncbi:HNH endonuclease [Streptomyces sp. NPDC093509]|uniref:HNH endonuclease n=1 Tax=Streptomyces sp. NPDC093509 TaxID=3154982 RepID=UPI00344CB255